ncbi:SMI1/KNR4 family protein [Luteolibacter sp. Populi]|uniref:SMI1/KNR4 family protein n=1 Tax=Luteolibacter sp. Populi TaxID=3230487 RepID=UPI0034678345
MEPKNEDLLKDFDSNEGVSTEIFRKSESELGCKFPPDYVEFMLACNGGEGFIGHQYVILWRAEELAEFNREYEVGEYAPGLTLFGSNGGGEAFAFDTRNDKMSVCMLPFIGMSRSPVKELADGFSGFIYFLWTSDEDLF